MSINYKSFTKEGYTVYAKDSCGDKFIECNALYIADAIMIYNSIGAWSKELVDNRTCEILAHANSVTGETYTVLGTK